MGIRQLPITGCDLCEQQSQFIALKICQLYVQMVLSRSEITDAAYG